MIAVKLKRDFTISTLHLALIFAVCSLQYVETSGATTEVQQKNSIIHAEGDSQYNEHIPEFQQQHQQNQVAYADTPSSLSYEGIQRILRNQLQEEDETNWQLNELSHAIKRRAAIPVFPNFQLTGRNLSAFNALRDFRGDHMHTKVLNLSRNALKSVNFSSLHDLQWVDLSHNQLTELPTDLFVGNQMQVSILNMNNNRISRGDPPLNFHLRELYLSGNEIEQLTALNLTLLKVLEILDLSCNRIKHLQSVFFPNLMHLKYLNLANNQLGSIYRENFYNLLSLNSMVLSYNNISDIDYETFLAIPNLQFLDLSYNQLKGESIRALQGIPDLIYLSIAENAEVSAYMQEFVASWSLKQFDASGTSLCKIPAVLAQSVRMLKLTDNWLKVINCGDLDSYPLLQYLDLSYNHLENIEDDALGRLEILEVLFLDHNKLNHMPYSLPISLAHLFLHDNQIMDIPIQAFQNLNHLQTLDLSGNQLLYLPALPLPKLITLNLQSSGLRGVSQAIVHTLPRLRDLLLENNPIKCSDLLGIAEWASPCRIMEHTMTDASTEFSNNNSSNRYLGQAKVPPSIIAAAVDLELSQQSQLTERIDFKQKYERLNNFFENVHTNCREGPALRRSQQERKQAICTPDAHNTDKLLKTSKTLIKNTHKNNRKYTTSLVPDDRSVIKPVPSSFSVQPLLWQLSNSLQKDVVNILELENVSRPNTDTSESSTAQNLMYHKTSKITKEFVRSATPTAVFPTMKITQKSININKTENIGNVLPNTTFRGSQPKTTKPPYSMQVVNSSSNFNQTVSTTNELHVPKNSKRSESTNMKTTVNTPMLPTLMVKDVFLVNRQISKNVLQNSKSNEFFETVINNHFLQHRHIPMQSKIKDRHLIGTPLLTYNGENLLVESDKLQIPPKMSGSNITTSIINTTVITPAVMSKEMGTKLEDSQMQENKSENFGIVHKVKKQNENTVATKWPHDITGLSELDKLIAKKEAITKPKQYNNKDAKQILTHNVKTKNTFNNYETTTAKNFYFIKKDKQFKALNHHLESVLDQQKANVFMNYFLKASTKRNAAAKLLDSIDYKSDILDPAQKDEDTTLAPDIKPEAVTPIHKHSTVNMPVHYLQPHEMHTFSELQKKNYVQPHISKHEYVTKAKQVQSDTKPDHWLDTRKPHTLDHPGLVMLLSSVLFVCLLLALMHVYRCKMPWKCQLAPPRLHQQLNKQSSAPSEFYDKTLRASNATSNGYSIASTGTTSCSSISRSSRSSSHNSYTSTIFEDDAFYIEIKPTTGLQSTGELLPMELLDKSWHRNLPHRLIDREINTSSPNSILKRNATSFNSAALTKTTTMVSALEKSDIIATDDLIGLRNAILMNDSMADDDVLVNEPIEMRCGRAHSTAIGTKHTTQKFDLW